MNRNLPLTLAALATAALGNVLSAQSNPPPWWGVQDEVTVSLHWDFSGASPFVPQQVAVPSWYNPAVTQAVPTGPLTIVANLNGHTNVLALTGTGAPLTARLDVRVDNDPHVDWVKVFWFQFDEFEGAGASVIEAIEQDLNQYKRSAVTTKIESLGQGWNRVTVSAQLVPQPGDEGVDFAFTTAALGSAAIDDLYVNSKCVKLYDSDATGDALGEPEAGFSLDLNVATGNPSCISAAVTEGPAPGFVRNYWVCASNSVGTPHELFRLNQAGVLIGVTPLAFNAASAPLGPTDLAVERIYSPNGTIVAQRIYAVVDARISAVAAIRLAAFDTTGAPTPALDITIAPPPGFPPTPHRFGLAFNLHGQRGAGTFWLTDQNGNAYEFERVLILGQWTGVHRRTITNLPSNVVGAGYDEIYGNFYWFSSTPVPTPSGPIQVNGSEWSGYDLQPTGARFFGNLNLPNPGGTPGGVASGLEVYRRDNGEFRALCVVRLPAQNRSMLYELKGPFRWGFSMHGTCGMRGLPFEGSTNFQLTLSGVPNASFAWLYVGFSQLNPAFSLAAFGMPEANVLINLHMNSVLLAPTAPGEFTFTLPLLPPGSGFSYVPMFFQWVVLDPTVQPGVTLSPGGKTIIY